ncbi:MAG: aldo/keto reductase [Pseudomonadales bacterium]|jgi:aryl-alcohol dehydrogenase-like predicted oxidoreductase|nr:aldo/keto reductase [Pseudomonadales bacterium]MDP7598140.1 aldo/keto reductase [Pseudomonadales bacterium]HJN49503.1 aldo/keto reductase [Pseudomonadales bacterium]
MSDLPTTKLGGIGYQVTKLGYGAMELRGTGGMRGRAITAESAGKILNAVLDAGINLIDTSPDYGQSEELIGAAISHRRSEFFLASKCGCPINQPPAVAGQRNPHLFTRKNVRAGVEQSLERMKTDHLDLVQVHISPSRQELEDNETIEELLLLKEQGKVRFIGMSGTLPNLPDHIAMECFDAFQIPYSAIERDHEDLITQAAEAGAGIIIRGGVAKGLPELDNATLEGLPDRFRQMIAQRREKWESADLTDLLDGMSMMEFMLRFTISHPNMHTTIVGTSNPDHLADNLVAAGKGVLPEDLYKAAKQRLT